MERLHPINACAGDNGKTALEQNEKHIRRTRDNILQYEIELLKLGVTTEEFDRLDYKMAELLKNAKLKHEEELLNNNIMVGMITASKTISFYSGDRHAADIKNVDYGIKFDLDTFDPRMQEWQTLWDNLTKSGIDPLPTLRQDLEDMLNGRAEQQ